MGLIRFHKLSGWDGNRILDAIPVARTEHVEAAIRKVSRMKAPRLHDSSDESLGGLLEQWEHEAFRIASIAHFGGPEVLCGGEVARFFGTSSGSPIEQLVEFRSEWICLSQHFIDETITAMPELELTWHHTEKRQFTSRTIALERLHEQFRGMVGSRASLSLTEKALWKQRDPYGSHETWHIGARHYGLDLQAEFEAAFRKTVRQRPAPTAPPGWAQAEWQVAH